MLRDKTNEHDEYALDRTGDVRNATIYMYRVCTIMLRDTGSVATRVTYIVIDLCPSSFVLRQSTTFPNYGTNLNKILMYV